MVFDSPAAAAFARSPAMAPASLTASAPSWPAFTLARVSPDMCWVLSKYFFIAAATRSSILFSITDQYLSPSMSSADIEW